MLFRRCVPTTTATNSALQHQQPPPLCSSRFSLSPHCYRFAARSMTSSPDADGAEPPPSSAPAVAAPPTNTSFGLAALKVPTSSLRIKNRLQVPTGPRQPVQLQPPPKHKPPTVPEQLTSLSSALEDASADADLADRPIAGLWWGGGGGGGGNDGNNDEGSSSLSLSDRGSSTSAAARQQQQALDTDSATPAGDPSMYRECSSRATFCGTLVAVEKSISQEGNNSGELFLLVCSEEVDDTADGARTISNSASTAHARGVVVRVLVTLPRTGRAKEGANDTGENTAREQEQQQQQQPLRVAALPQRLGATLMVSGPLKMQRVATGLTDARKSDHHPDKFQYNTIPTVVVSSANQLRVLMEASDDDDEKNAKCVSDLLQRTVII